MSGAAHSRDLIVVGHSYSYKGAMELLSAGVDGLTHMFLDQPPSNEFVKTFKTTGAHCNPTLTGNSSHSKQVQQLQQRFFNDPLAQEMLFDKQPREALGLADESKADIQYSYASTKALYNAGVPLIVGSDSSGQRRGQAYGLTVHMEIHQMVHKIGMTPFDVLKSATSLIADRFGFKDRGRIAVGMNADLVLIKGDVREMLKSEETLCLPICGVWRDGIAAKAYSYQQS
jgi:imidazolonepropionase-like amidohydrolase